MLPDGWKDGKVQDLINSLEAGVSVNGENRFRKEGEKAVLKVSAVTYGIFDPSACKVIVANELTRARINPKSGQIIISRSNTQNLVGACVYVKENYNDLFLSDKLWQTVPKPNVKMKWLSYILASSKIRYILSNLATGTSGSMKNITKNELLSLKILIPPPSEQQKIAKILSTWDKAIEKLESLILAKKTRKKALMQQLLTEKKRFDGFDDEWDEFKLKEILTEKKSRNKKGLVERVLSVTNHSGFVLPENQFSRRVASNDLSNYKIVEKGQFGYNPSRINVGSFARLDEYQIGVLSPMYVIFSINDKKLDSNFFINWMSSHEAKQKISSSTQGSVRDSVGFNTLGMFIIKLPSLSEQQKVASVLSAADQEIENHQQQLETLKQQKKGLMQQLLTGKKRVKLKE